MLDANNFTFLISFRNSLTGHFIVNTQLSNNGLQDLAKSLKERKKDNTHSFDVYQFNKAKRKFSKITIDRFIVLTEFCTDLNQVLTDIYITKK